jgi:hypothetical protein
VNKKQAEISRSNGYVFTLMGFSEKVDMLLDASLLIMEEIKSAHLNQGVPKIEVVYTGDPYDVNIPVLKSWTNNRGSKTALKHYEKFLKFLGEPEHILVLKEKIY